MEATCGGGTGPIGELEAWIEAARGCGLAHPAAAAFVTASQDARPTARTVTVKRLEADAVVLTTALWTRKAREVDANPRVALLFHWPELGRQVHLAGEAALAERALAEELFAERDLAHRLQTVLSHQGQEIDAAELERLRDRLAHLLSVEEAPPRCPDDWGALRIVPEAVEFWSEAPDRMHERRLFEREGERWRVKLLSP